ncbi:MAG: 6-phosphogluconolactonase [Bacteroidales bacterium]|nr:6-phosphogluconolactonase [Bacteroidales bacterium]
MIRCYHTINELAAELALEFRQFALNALAGNRKVSIAISGGTTPRAFFEQLAWIESNQQQAIPWSMINLFWVDERCVPPDHADSNYRMTRESMLDKITIPAENIYRIHGEANPSDEARRYAKIIESIVPSLEGIPQFDWILLGMGDDGHTASIFPDRMDLLTSSSVCEAVTHPAKDSNRVTLTGQTLLQAKKISFLVTGATKSIIIRQILNKEPGSEKYPAAYIHHRTSCDWLLDKQAAQYLKIQCRDKY